MSAQHVLPQSLAGMRIVVTRARQQAGDLVQRLHALGSEVIELPAIEIEPVESPELDAAIARLNSYDWLLFTSVNAVDIFFDRMAHRGGGSAQLSAVRVGTIGAATAERVAQRGGSVAFVPEEFVAESMVEGLVALGMTGARVLLPRARIARDTLPEGLRAAGATVDVIVVYDTMRPRAFEDSAVAALRTGSVDLLTFASPSTVRSVAELLEPEMRHRIPVACIGPITARAAQEAGFPVSIQAIEFSIPGLVDAIVRQRRRMAEVEDDGERAG
jgi:uroporphyrinogen III methyltransferase / synthase